MKKNRVLNLIVILAAAALVGIMPGYVFAITPSLTVNTISGESELTYRVSAGTSATPAEVRVTMANTAAPYTVRQELLTQPSNGRDEIRWDNFTLRGLMKATAAGGNFRAASGAAMPILSFDPLYTNTAGNPDDFILVYYANIPTGSPAGSYRGRIRYVLTPLNSSQEQVSCFLNILVDVGTQAAKTAEAGPQIEIAALTGLNSIILNTAKPEQQAFEVGVTINRPFKNMFSIVQDIPEAILSTEGNQLDANAIHCETRDVNKGMGIIDTPFSARQQTVFTSLPNGDAPAGFSIIYSLGDVSSSKAGRYRAKLNYYLEETARTNLLKSLDLEVEIAPIFDFTLSPQDQKNMLEFKDLKPMEPPRRSEVVVEIKSNKGKQYQLSQNVYSDLTDKEGNTIQPKYFTVTTESLDTKGTLKQVEKKEIRTGDTILFVSDNKGSSDKLGVIYELTCPRDIKAGDYSTRITYSLLEI